ncbi:MAG TPA: hypothetical protein VK453_00115 [Micromonosporaceae bacterium]|nr:hypothetical protein [Micromonosporaceae bacterium]
MAGPERTSIPLRWDRAGDIAASWVGASRRATAIDPGRGPAGADGAARRSDEGGDESTIGCAAGAWGPAAPVSFRATDATAAPVGATAAPVGAMAGSAVVAASAPAAGAASDGAVAGGAVAGGTVAGGTVAGGTVAGRAVGVAAEYVCAPGNGSVAPACALRWTVPRSTEGPRPIVGDVDAQTCAGATSTGSTPDGAELDEEGVETGRPETTPTDPELSTADSFRPDSVAAAPTPVGWIAARCTIPAVAMELPPGPDVAPVGTPGPARPGAGSTVPIGGEPASDEAGAPDTGGPDAVSAPRNSGAVCDESAERAALASTSLSGAGGAPTTGPGALSGALRSATADRWMTVPDAAPVSSGTAALATPGLVAGESPVTVRGGCSPAGAAGVTRGTARGAGAWRGAAAPLTGRPRPI